MEFKVSEVRNNIATLKIIIRKPNHVMYKHLGHYST